MACKRTANKMVVVLCVVVVVVMTVAAIVVTENGGVEETIAHLWTEKVTKENSDDVKEVYNEAKHKVEEAYDDLVTKNGFTEKAKAEYAAAKEQVSDTAGEVGAKMRHCINQQAFCH